MTDKCLSGHLPQYSLRYAGARVHQALSLVALLQHLLAPKMDASQRLCRVYRHSRLLRRIHRCHAGFRYTETRRDVVHTRH